ncbi:MAG: hypothetical protein GQ572_08635 [Gammaproteobacteria bacterium]|nr:hypothetical protein [Gammaproteobacteria bacterium]
MPEHNQFNQAPPSFIFSMKKQSRLYMLLREPLLHFLVIGAALFIIFYQINDIQTQTDNRILITKTDLDRLAATWLRSMGRPPSAQEREQQLKHFIREQVLYREAMTMGLNQDDVIVRRRLAKKMEYLFNDLSFIPEPTETELSSYLTEHASKFTLPATITFSQIYLNPGKRKQDINKDAEQLLEQLKETTVAIDTIEMGDRSLLPYEFTAQRKSEIAGMFGTAFAVQAFALPANNWQGPITSEYGVHLIHISSRTEARLPPLAEIRESVSREWRTTKQQEANEIFYQSLYQRYEIILDDDVANDAMVSSE